jgi:ERCC4-type nuclease
MSFQNSTNGNIEIENDNIKSNNNLSDNIYLIVDLREKGAGNENFKVEILNKLQHPIPIEEKNLSLGDFTWIYKDQLDGEEYMLDFIIERKTLNDLSASIMDGRYNEQKYRLKNSPYKNIYYLFEGTELNTHTNSNISKDAINTAINNTINIHDINFYRTLSTKDTVNKLIELDSNIRKNFSFLKDNNGKKITYKKYIEIFAKTKNSTVEEIFLRQLRCFEHCGKKCVEILNNCFQTPLSFYQLIQGLKEKNVNEKDMENVLACCYYLHENKKEINVKNILNCFENNEEIEKFKKDTLFTKLFRKMAIFEMLNFYCFYEEDKKIMECEMNNEEKKIDNINKINEEKKSEKKKEKEAKKKKKRSKKTKENLSEDNSDINSSISISDDYNYEIKKRNKKEKKKGKSKENKKKKKKMKSNESSDSGNIEKDNISIDENCNEVKNNNNSYNDIEIKESFKHLEDIGNDKDFNNFNDIEY